MHVAPVTAPSAQPRAEIAEIASTPLGSPAERFDWGEDRHVAEGPEAPSWAPA